MRYLLIDRIQMMHVNRRIVALKNIALSEDVFTDHFLGFPIMPGALLIESLAQTGTALIEISSNFTKKALLVMIERAKFRKFVTPGDQLIITMDIASIDDISAQLDGIICVKDECVAEARVVFTIQNPEKIYTPKTRYLMEAVYDVWLKDAQILEENLPRETKYE